MRIERFLKREAHTFAVRAIFIVMYVIMLISSISLQSKITYQEFPRNVCLT